MSQQVKLCHCGHGSDCHAVEDDGIGECQDCGCRMFSATGLTTAALVPARHWASGRTMQAQKDLSDEYWAFLRKTAEEVRRDMPDWMKR